MTPSGHPKNSLSHSSSHANEVGRGDRFKFGENWRRFLNDLNDERILAAENSLRRMLEVEDLRGKSFLDVGSGSGLFSLAARRLGATVHSFDYDPQSVACTRELCQRYFGNDPLWKIESGSVLDAAFITRLGKFHYVYSWGVLHHTAAMWDALERIAEVVMRPEGRVFIAIYNDQKWISRYWTLVKKTYNRGPLGRLGIITAHLPYLGAVWSFRVLSGRTELSRGMAFWRDALDWLGGYPFEVAKPEEIFEFFKSRRFELTKLRTCGGRQGCNEFVFRSTG
jgi:2-polyprenyl-3-methyl-5-hydroxy-6-metoxy-1,4-benzoquinol methylase